MISNWSLMQGEHIPILLLSPHYTKIQLLHIIQIELSINQIIISKEFQ